MTKEIGQPMDVLTLQRAGIAANTGTLGTFDSTHSTIEFSVKQMLIATVRGHFGSFRGRIQFDVDRPGDAFVEVQIDADSIDTGIAKRDEHLRSVDFFNVAVYPTITFRGMRVEPVIPLRRDRVLVAGDLTMHGVTRPVELEVQQSGDWELWDVEAASFTATAKISRKEFGIGMSQPLDASGIAIGDDVTIAIDVQVEDSPLDGR
jgi:polyisoprenoid-binding protein YceI